MRGTVPEQIGPFRVLRRLGAGGMAETFEAERTGPGGFRQRVCVKRIQPQWATDPQLVRLFVREARIAARLSHRSVTRVVDFGEDRGTHYLALELVEGMDLRRLLRALPEPRRLPRQLAAFVGMEIAEALHHAHTQQWSGGPVVHRDVSPANILLSVDGDVKLTDFGISKALLEAPVTRSERVRGNVWYMAPEQLEPGQSPDPRSDLYSLGVVLYQCLTGRRPHPGPTDFAAMIALAEGRRTPLVELAPHLPAGLTSAVERLGARRPSDRFSDAGEVAASLAPWCDVPTARRALGETVRVLLDRERELDARSTELVRGPPPAPSAPRREPPRAFERPRWKRHALGPGAWVAAAPRRPRRSWRALWPLLAALALLAAVLGGAWSWT